MNAYQPLAAKLRPTTLDDFIGQSHLLADGKPLRRAILKGNLHSMILWGPPGTGKTTLAKLIANHANANFEALSATFSGVKEIRECLVKAQINKKQFQQETLLFIDEVHRFNKSQQDAFLPWVEDGTVTFIGATTENPSFELNNALLSRARIYVLKPHSHQDILHILQRALDKEFSTLQLTEKQLTWMVDKADGDARQALTLLEITASMAEHNQVSDSIVSEIVTGSVRRFDKQGEIFYDLISALHKSVRGSNPDAALYWYARMIDGGCDPLYIARRVVRMAVEDIGNADPRALEISLNAWDVQERLGSPEGELAIAQAIVYIACAAKSNAVYTAYSLAVDAAAKYGTLEVPLHLRNAPTQLMKKLNYGTAYRYAHDEPHAYAAGECYFPKEISELQFYFPTQRGLEQKIREKLEYLKRLDSDANETGRKKA